MISNFQWTLTHPPRMRFRNLYLSGLDCRGFTYSRRPRTPSFESRLLMGNILCAQPIGHNSLGGGQAFQHQTHLASWCRKQMQAVRLDPSPEQDPNGWQSCNWRMASPYFMPPMQWTNRNRPSPLSPVCPFAQMVRTQVSTLEQLAIPQNTIPTNFDSIMEWWEAAAKSVQKDEGP